MRWQIRPRELADGRVEWQVTDAEDRERAVASFATAEEAQAHAQRLAEGPFDWDDQAAWQDPDDDDDDGWEDRGW